MNKLKHPQTFRNHNFEQLLILSGVYKEMDKQLTANIGFKAKWSEVCEWNENCRYLTGKNKTGVEDFLISIKETAEWIQKQL